VIRTTGCRLLESSDCGIWPCWLRSQAQIGKDAIVAIGRWLGEAFAVNGNNAFADFAGWIFGRLIVSSQRAEIRNSGRGEIVISA